MLEYIDEILTAFNKMDPSNSVTKSSATPENLLKAVKDCDKLSLSLDKSKLFHNLVSNTLYTTKKARPDTFTSVVFLSTIVKELDTNDCKKLAHLMNYTRKTRNIPLILWHRNPKLGDRYIICSPSSHE